MEESDVRRARGRRMKIRRKYKASARVEAGDWRESQDARAASPLGLHLSSVYALLAANAEHRKRARRKCSHPFK
jgi:ribosomal protein L32E